MWAAANDGSERYRRRRHRDKRRRTDDDGGDDKSQGDRVNANDKDNDSDSDSDISSDGERSTTESVHGEPSGDNTAQTLSHGDAAKPAAAAITSSAKHKRRKRKRTKKKKKKKPIREETPEASMARLKSSYSAAMAAVGALHRVSQQYCTVWAQEEGNGGAKADRGEVKEAEASGILPPGDGGVMEKGADNATIGHEKIAENNETTPPENAQHDDDPTNNEGNTNSKEKQRKAHSTIQRVAQAARTALEQSLLLDHIILAPIFLPEKKTNKTRGKRMVVASNRKNNGYDNDSLEGMSSAWLDAWNISSIDLAAATANNGQNASRSNAAASQISLTKWNRLSAAHRTVIKQISYLALVNYADLLLCGCSCNRSFTTNGGQKGDILDRGAVSKLDVLKLFSSLDASAPAMIDGSHNNDMGNPTDIPPSHSSGCLWSNESTERTIRLALAAYCDASELDSTDPTLWFKLACAARALGRQMDYPSSSTLAASMTKRSYRCLERLALERGISSLPPGVPPNRLLMRAWKEMENWDRRSSSSGNDVVALERTEDETGVDAAEEGVPGEEAKKCPVELVFHLPRYSWVTLGRILMRACREGVSYGRSLPDGALHHVWSTNCHFPEDYEFGSPLVGVRISPLLAIPHGVLGRICEYLEEPTGIKRLTCTCRAMPLELVSARAKILEEKKRIVKASEAGDDEACTGSSNGKGGTSNKSIDGTGAEDDPIGCDTETTSASKIGDKQSEADFISPPRRGRVSKRVRSQMIQSEKQTERKSKRSSVEYCLLAGTLSCTAQNPYYAKLLKTDFNWEQLPLIKKCMQTLPVLSQADESHGLNSSGASVDKKAQSSNQGEQINAFLAPASLNAFVQKWSGNNSGPRHFLELFLVHVSLSARDVFDTEMTDSLSSCVIDCFDMLCAEQHAGLTPWYGPEMFEIGNQALALQVLAVNLLSAELRLKRCESHDIGSQEHQEDSDVLAFMIPNLMQFVGATIANGKNFLQLQCRCYWLASLYHTWIGRCSNDSTISKAAEDFGLEYLSKTMASLSESPYNEMSSIKTPQLGSSGRCGDHWSALSTKSLSMYRDHLQSSSIVSRARQCFQDIQSAVQERSKSEDDEAGNITADDKARLASLGAELLERYNVTDEKSSDVLKELLEDFLLLNEDSLRSTDMESSTGTGEMYWGRIWTDVPSSKASSIVYLSKECSRPSIIQVLASSLLASEEKIPSVFWIYSKMVLTALILRAQALRKESNDGTQIDFEEGNAENSTRDIDVTKAGARKDNLLLLVVNFFTEKMTDMIASYANETEMHSSLEAFLEGDDLGSIMFSSINVSPPQQKDPNENSTIQQLQSVSRLVLAIREYQGLSRQAREKVESVYFITLIKALIRQKKDFVELSSTNDKRLKKWQSQLISKSELIFSTANEIAELLSLNPSTVNNDDGSVNVSHLIKAVTGLCADELQSLKPAVSPVAQFSEALLFFWKFLNDKFDTSSPAEKSARSRLMIPISSAMVSLCGSLGLSVEGDFAKVYSKADEKPSTLSFSDYFDSEDSVNGMFLSDGSLVDENQRCRRSLLRKICQLVQCISLVFRSVNEKHISASPQFPSSQHGPFLPLVVVRVLSAMSENIFSLFSEAVDGEIYPYGARGCGNKIDTILGSAYMQLFGFSFSGAESEIPKNQAPESIKAAIALFRCIKRVYRDNRRSPPEKAYETVELALPPAEESRVGKAIRSFLFDAKKSIDVVRSTSDIPPGFPEWVLCDESEKVCISGDEQLSNIEMLRRGVAAELAKGQIKQLDSSRTSPSDMDDKGLSEERGKSQSHELSLNQKFCAVLDDLCYNPNKAEGWVVLSETLGFKADQICDKLVPVQQSYDSSDFCLKVESKRRSPASKTLDQLRQFQLEEFEEMRQNWRPFIGDNLCIYMKYPWSSLTSLQACAKDMGSTLDEQNSDYLCWKEIESKFAEGDYVSWANSWAGMFIMALRTMRIKALLVARYLAKKSQGGMHPSEVSEDLGTAHYSDLMASSVYGYPMHGMTPHEKREIAERSNFYFQEAIQLSTSSVFTQKSQTVPWEIMFMIGKSYEKIASTLGEEVYSLDSARLYETVLIDALNNHLKAYTEARKVESSGGPDKTGGSSHGALECLYRLHTARFKCLLSAIKRVKGECELAESEAFRIASVTWFDESNQSGTNGVRGKIWDAFADCVDAFSHCRREIPLFHRAAYRLAQAFNFAPAFHNPDCNVNLGSKQAVPATRSYRVRGLDTGSCAESANIAISKLFDKKRAQLCAVWVTTSAAPPPFEVLNDSVRKYDALRLKYIRAYIDSMQVCGRKEKIEALLNWAIASNQDLPTFYEASASVHGGDPGRHSKQSLLRGSGRGFITEVKHNAIRALAEMILKDLAVMKKNGVDDEGKLQLTKLFKLAHSLFLRLNSPCKEVVEFTESNKLAIVEAFSKCYLSIQSGYRISSIHFDEMDSETLCSILEGAVSTAKAMIQEAKAKKEK